MLKIYQIGINGKVYEFRIESLEQGMIYISVPDLGGQMDSVAKYPEQLEWLEEKLEGIVGLKRVWNTSWEVESENAMKNLENLFINEGGILTLNI